MSVVEQLTEDDLRWLVEQRRQGHALRGAAAGLYERMLLQRLQREIIVANPGNGSDWIWTVPAGSTYEVLAVQAAVVSSAVVATRIPEVRYTNQDGTVLARMVAATTIAANASEACLWHLSAGSLTNTGGVAMSSLPGRVALSGGYVIRSVTFNLDAGDSWSSIRLIVIDYTPARVAQVMRQLAADLDSAAAII